MKFCVQRCSTCTLFDHNISEELISTSTNSNTILRVDTTRTLKSQYISVLSAEALTLVLTELRLVAVLDTAVADGAIVAAAAKARRIVFWRVIVGCWPRISFLMAPVFLLGSRVRLDTLAPMFPMSPRANREPPAMAALPGTVASMLSCIILELESATVLPFAFLV